MGGGLGLVIGALLLRHGLGAESLAWLAVFLLAPASAVYYPVSVLPTWLQYFAWALGGVSPCQWMSVGSSR